MELGLGIIVLILLFFIITTEITKKIHSKKISNMKNIYLGKLTNSDSPIYNAMKYLKLTNGIKQQLNEDKK